MLLPQLKWPDSAQFGEPRTETKRSKHVFDILAAQVDKSLSELDAVFCEAGLADSCLEGHQSQVRTDASGDGHLEVVDCHTLPFAVHATVDAMWKLLSSRSLDIGGGVYQVCLENQLFRS